MENSEITMGKRPAEIYTGERRQWPVFLSIFALALIVRSLNGYFIGTHLDDAAVFPSGIYKIFDVQARDVLAGTASAFWIDDPLRTNASVYPPGYSLWLVWIYGISGLCTVHVVQVVQVIVDSASVLIIVAIGIKAFGRRVGVTTGFMAALSPLLAIYGAAPLADAPTNWVLLGGVWMLVLAAKRKNLLCALGAGMMIGLSCWFRANGSLMPAFWAAALFLCSGTGWKRSSLLASSVLLGAFLLISPIIIRNSTAFQAFVPTGLGAGTNLWEGIGETERAEEFGAVYGDAELIERERTELNLPKNANVTLYWPDGVNRDRERMRKGLNVITSNPVWYAGVMARRMMGHLKFTGSGSPIYGSSGIHLTPVDCLPPSLQYFPLTALVTFLDGIQSTMRVLLLPLMLLGISLGLRKNVRVTLITLATVFYYLIVGTFMHSEIRYSLPMQSVLFIFAGLAMSWIILKLPVGRAEETKELEDNEGQQSGAYFSTGREM